MAKKKENFRDVKPEELEKMIAGWREEIRMIKFKAEGAKSKNVKESSALKKNIARALTVINSK